MDKLPFSVMLDVVQLLALSYNQDTLNRRLAQLLSLSSLFRRLLSSQSLYREIVLRRLPNATFRGNWRSTYHYHFIKNQTYHIRTIGQTVHRAYIYRRTPYALISCIRLDYLAFHHEECSQLYSRTDGHSGGYSGDGHSDDVYSEESIRNKLIFHEGYASCDLNGIVYTFIEL